MPLQPGQKAPEFTLLNTEEKEISLADFQNKNVVLLFFPKAYTRVCTTELCLMRDEINIYAGLNAEIIGISVDPPSTLAAYKADQQLPFNLLSDADKTVSQAYESLYDTGVSKRSAFVIDHNGIIQHAEVLENAGEIPNFDAVKETLEKIK
ncbi:redoxin domain-containing protein [Nibrella saemangeumensis]|uniref:Redoxin domain-containing protein n=1 Tax=Nibrella saemangeumensis TaxID=1084526 RepID=A0ABP8MXB7_9BACT